MNGCTSDISDALNVKTSIKSLEEIGAKIYPNPITDKIYIDLPTNLLNENNKFRLFAMNGEMINISDNITKTKDGVMIELNMVSSGVYMLELETSKGKAIYRVTVNK